MSARAKTAWDWMSLPQQVGWLCSNPRLVRFDRFLRERFEGYAGGTAETIVCRYCEVESRSDIKPATKAGNRWLLLVSSYRAWEISPQVGAA